MWHEDWPPEKSWAALWGGLIVCGNCSGIRTIEGLCPVCSAPLPASEPTFVALVDGREIEINRDIYMGAEGRYEDWVYLEMLQREWNRPLPETDRLAVEESRHKLSPKAAIVILFWSYFETRIERLLRASMHGLPQGIVDDLLKRYVVVGARIDRLYQVLFNTTYWADLTSLDCDRIKEHLLKVQEKRNDFAHGNPTAIDDTLVKAVIDNLKDEHESWIAVFNKRATCYGRPRIESRP